MRFSFTSLFRLVVIVALTSATAAVVVSRMDPPAPTYRLASSVNHAAFCGYYWAAGQHDARWLDLRTGRLADLPIARGESLDTASLSPWKDELGRSQLIGRWSRTEPGSAPSEGLTNQFGLARYRFPSGERIDYVTTEVIPAGPVSWFPGTRAQVMFTGGDGSIYRFAFESEDGRDEPDAAPLKVRIEGGTRVADHLDGAFFCELNWPSDPRFNGLALVSLRTRTQVVGDPLDRARYSRGQVWWVRFNGEGSKIVDGGRLFDPTDGEGELDERSPVFGIATDGQPLVTFKVKRPAIHGWELRVAKLAREALSAGPRMPMAATRLIARHQSACPAPLSPDGRRAYSLELMPGSKNPALKSFEVEPAVARSAARPPGMLAATDAHR